MYLNLWLVLGLVTAYFIFLIHDTSSGLIHWFRRTANTVTNHTAHLVCPLFTHDGACSLVKLTDQPPSAGRVTDLDRKGIFFRAAVHLGWQSFLAETQSSQIGALKISGCWWKSYFTTTAEILAPLFANFHFQ